VVFYHAFPSHLPGGFIGVDVFFVISGFLITQIITKQVIEGKFSLLNFYCRRVKRIYPALILMLCFSLWIISKFTQIDLVNFSIDTLNAALVFCANLSILLHKKDYFDADIRGNPLLHLWSLGVEEQFYIIWPFSIMLVFKCCKQRAMTILTVFTLFSFVFSIICVNIDSKLAFYFPLCRFWQMSIGGMLGYADFRFRSKVVNNLLSAVGLMVILMTSFFLNDESLFPGFWALLPTLGCAFIIQAKNESFLSKYVLSCKLLTFIGKISYSFYLWHWPLIVYSRVMYPHGSTSIFSSMFFMVGLAFGLSILTYFLAENPIRKVKNNKIVFLLLALMVCIGLAAIQVNKKAT
jgi:peptidoglycan/LPS O-acetylase OafA/YrhL